MRTAADTSQALPRIALRPQVRPSHIAPRRRFPRAGWVALGALTFVALVVLLYQATTRARLADSDTATPVLQGQSMSAGHLTLHGWSLGWDSFWTIDGFFNTIGVALVGVRSVLLDLVPAIIGAAVVFFGAALARGERRGAPGVAAALTVVAVLGLPTFVLSTFFLRGAAHVGTALWCLVAFAGLRRGRVGWGWALAVVFLAAGLLGDFLTLPLGVVPACVAGLIAMARTRSWRGGLAPVTAAMASVALAGVVRLLATAVGTFSVTTAHIRASGSQMKSNIGHMVPWTAHLLGVGKTPLGYGGVAGPLELVHSASLVVVAGGFLAALVGLVRGAATGRTPTGDATEAWRLDDLLVVGMVGSGAVFVYLTLNSTDTSFHRYLMASVIFGAVLAGRLVGTLAAVVRWPPIRRAGGLVGVAVIAAFAVSFGVNVTQPQIGRPYVTLGQFLQAHRLTDGVGDYWSSNITTVGMNNRVRVRPVIATPEGRLERYSRQSTAAWYGTQRFRFLVFNLALPWGNVDAATGSATFGPPANIYTVGTYQVLVWSHPISVYASPDTDD